MKKRILCLGDSNTWGYDAETNGRFPDDVRWTGRLSERLGDSYTVIEEGLSGRTTVFEDPLNEGMSALPYLYPCLMSHGPLDYMVVMLGTNDCKERFSATAKNIADGMKRLVQKAKVVPCWREDAKILIVAPAPIDIRCEQSPVAGEMGRCSKKSECLAEEYQKCAEENRCDYLDAAPFCTMNEIDFMHLDAQSHDRFSAEIEKIVRRQV